MEQYVNRFYLTAAEVNAQEEMPLSRLVTLIIETATAHANRLGIGYDHMMETNSSWVLSRLSVDVLRMPWVNHEYEITTWVTSVNRIYSERMFKLADAANGEVIAWVHTTWMAIDMDTRRPTDLTIHRPIVEAVGQQYFGGDKGGRLLPVSEEESGYDYTFKVSDIDVNRHVTTRRYIDLMTDLWPLEMYNDNTIARFEIAFKHEARYGETCRAMSTPHQPIPGAFDVEIRVGDTSCALARIRFRSR